jgi:hypothetical protein
MPTNWSGGEEYNNIPCLEIAHLPTRCAFRVHMQSEHFSDLQKSLYTMFVVACLDGWDDIFEDVSSQVLFILLALQCRVYGNPLSNQVICFKRESGCLLGASRLKMAWK